MKTAYRKKVRHPGIVAVVSSPALLTGGSMEPPVTGEALSRLRQDYLEQWSDPMNTKSEEDIAKELNLPIAQLVTWRLDPAFHEVAYQRYTSALRSSIIPVLRKLVLRAHEGDREAVRQFLEITGLVSSKGPTINQVNIGGTGDSFQSSMIRDLSDDDLDREIGAAFAQLYSSDIEVRGGKVTPIEDAEVVSVK